MLPWNTVKVCSDKKKWSFTGKALGSGWHKGREVRGFAEEEVGAFWNYSTSKSGLPTRPSAHISPISPRFPSPGLGGRVFFILFLFHGLWGWRVAMRSGIWVAAGDMRLSVLYLVHKSTSSSKLFLYLQGWLVLYRIKFIIKELDWESGNLVPLSYPMTS